MRSCSRRDTIEDTMTMRSISSDTTSAGTGQPATDPAARQPAAVGDRSLVLHAAWVLRASVEGHQLALWAEAESPPARRARRLAAPAAPAVATSRPHPFAARRADLLPALERMWKMARPG